MSQSKYLKKAVKNFKMSDAKSVLTLIGAHFKLSIVQDDDECIDTGAVPYSSVLGSIIYAMVGCRLDLASGIGLDSRFMTMPC